MGERGHAREEQLRKTRCSREIMQREMRIPHTRKALHEISACGRATTRAHTMDNVYSQGRAGSEVRARLQTRPLATSLLTLVCMYERTHARERATPCALSDDDAQETMPTRTHARRDAHLPYHQRERHCPTSQQTQSATGAMGSWRLLASRCTRFLFLQTECEDRSCILHNEGFKKPSCIHKHRRGACQL